jgi:hypothetical protein
MTPADASILAPILSAAVGMAAALVAGLSVYFTYRGRHNQFRQVVYGRQMDACFDIAESMANLYAAAQNILAHGSPRLKEEDARRQLRVGVREEHERFTGTVNRSLIVLPSKVKAAVDHFNDTLVAVSAPVEDLPPAPPGADPPPPPGEALARAFERAVNSIRHHLAVDSLTTGMLREMGIGSESVALKSLCHGVNPLLPVGRAVT